MLTKKSFVILFALFFVIACGCSGRKKNAPLPENTTETKAQKPATTAAPVTLMLATTTSTQNTGLLDYLLPEFEKKYNVKIHTLAVGTGQALKAAMDGNVDVLLVHDKKSEMEFMNQGWGTERREFIYNDFIFVGPAADPAGVKKAATSVDVLKRIAAAKSVFISRGDDSGTHKKELALWEQAGISPKGDWYIEVGQGMEDTLRMADEKNGYTLSDRGTFLSTRKSLSIGIVFEGDPTLLNVYSVMTVNPDKHKGGRPIMTKEAKLFYDWITSPETLKKIQDFKVEGETLFHPVEK